VKPKLKILFQRLGRERESNYRHMTNFLYAAIYDLTSDRDCSDKHRGLQTLKARICRLHAAHHSALTLDTGAEDRFGDEPSLFHLLRTAKSRQQRTVRHIELPDANTVHTSPAILRGFPEYFTAKYAAIPSDPAGTRRILQHVRKRLPAEANMAFECPITYGELYLAIQTGKGKAPGPDGLAHELYQEY
jgi:hypothetical protein